MIADRTSAEILFKAAFAAYSGLESAAIQVAPALPPEELASMKRRVGMAMGEILTITEPILKVHPELLPDAWRDDNGNA